MPVSFNLRDKFVWVRNDIEPQSLEIVQRMLNEGEIVELYIEKMPLDIFQSLNLSHLKGLSIGDIPCFDLDFLSTIPNLKHLKLDFSSVYPEDGKIILKKMPAISTLESLFLEGKGIRSLDYLPAFPNLKELDLRGINDDSLAFLHAYPLIIDIWISECNLKGWSNLLHCQNMVRLRVFETPPDFDEMISSGAVNRSVKVLELSGCPTLRNLEPLRIFESLRYLDISLHNLRSEKGIEKCTALEIINIEDTLPKAILKRMGRFLFADVVSVFSKSYRRRIDLLRKLDAGNVDYTDMYTKYFQSSLADLPKDLFSEKS